MACNQLMACPSRVVSGGTEIASEIESRIEKQRCLFARYRWPELIYSGYLMDIQNLTSDRNLIADRISTTWSLLEKLRHAGDSFSLAQAAFNYIHVT